MELSYRMQDGVNLPNLVMPNQPEGHLGKYAQMRRDYLMLKRRVLYTNLKTTGKLTAHLLEVQEQAQQMVNRMVSQMAVTEGVTEELKAQNPQKWVGLMNNLKHSAEEVVMESIIRA